MRDILVIGLGGFVGANARWLVYRTLGSTPTAFPWATVLVNVTGCFAAGLLMTMIAANAAPAWVRPLLVIGFLGAFTTFSAFGRETISLLQHGRLGTATAYVVASLVVGLAATAAGVVAGRALA
jgi:CrcB protein